MISTLNDALAEIKSRTTFLSRQTVSTDSIRVIDARIVDAGTTGRVSLNEYAGEQIRRWLRVEPDLPGRLGPKLFGSVAQKLWDDSVRKHEIPQFVQLIRNGSGHVIGLDDPELLTLDNAEICDAIHSAIPANEIEQFEVHYLRYDDGGFAFHASTPRLAIEPNVGDIVQGGFSVRHSAIGERATQVRHYLHRLVCRNGMTAPVCTVEKALRVRRLRSGGFDRGQQLERCAALIREGKKQLEAKLSAFRSLASENADARQVVIQFCMRHGLSKKVRDELLNALAQDELGMTGTMFDVVNAIARVATHSRIIREAIRERLSTFAGILAEPDHARHCPHCHSVLYAPV